MKVQHGISEHIGVCRNDSTQLPLIAKCEKIFNGEVGRHNSIDTVTESTLCESEGSDCSVASDDMGIGNDEDASQLIRPKLCYFPHKMEVNRAHMKTVRLHNVPRSYTVDSLLELFQNEGVRGFDFVSLPFDVHTRTCKGYAIVNFACHADAKLAMALLSGFSDWQQEDHKAMQVSWNTVLQGLAANVAHCKLSRDPASELSRPVLFKDGHRVDL